MIMKQGGCAVDVQGFGQLWTDGDCLLADAGIGWWAVLGHEGLCITLGLASLWLPQLLQVMRASCRHSCCDGSKAASCCVCHSQV